MRTGGAAIRVLASVGIVVATLYGVFIGGGWLGLHSSALRTATLAVVITAIGLWTATAVVAPRWRPRSRILPALAVPLAVLALTTLTSRQPRLGVDYVAWSVVLVALYLLLVRLMASPSFREVVLTLTASLAAVIGVWYLHQVVTTWIDWWGLVGRIAAPPLRPGFASLTFGSPSAVMAMSLLLTLPAVAWIGFATRARRAWSIALLGLAFPTTVLSGSRAGWAGLAIGWAIAAAAWLLVASNRARVQAVVRSPALRLGLAGAVTLGMAGGIVLLPGLVFRAGSGGEALRVVYAESALRMFAEAPLVGTGPGTWVAQRIAYTIDPANDYYIPHAHDLYVQTVAETGIVGALAAILIAGVVGRLLLRAIRSGEAARVRMGWAAIFGLAYFGGHQLLDFYAGFPAALMAVAIPIAWLDAADEAADPGGHGAPRRADGVPRRAMAGSIAALAAFALAVGFLRWSESVATVHEAAVAALNGGDNVQALALARRAAADDPAMTPYHLTLGLAASRTGHPAEAMTAFATVAERDDLPSAWLGLAAARAELGDRAGALADLERALRLGIAQPAIAIGAADLYERLGDTARADAAVAAALAVEPRLAGDPNLPSSDRAVVVDRAIDAAGTSGSAILMALEAGRPAAVGTILARMDPGTRSTYERIVAAWNGDTTALAELEEAARARPLDLDLVVWIGRIMGRREPAAAERKVSWANIVNGNAGLLAREIRITTDAADSGGAGFSSQFYGHYTYRRPTPWDLTPGGLVRLTSP